MAISNNNTGIRTGVCTSTTRPTAPYEGQHIYETDTDIEYVWNGSAWVETVSAASPAFTGTPTAPTATAGTNTTQLATTAFVTTADNLKANLAGPTFTGVPTAPTAAAGTNTTQLATTAFANTAGGLVYIASGSISGLTTTFTNCFSSTYDNYQIIITVSIATAGDAPVPIYLKWNGSTGSTYYWNGYYSYIYGGGQSADSGGGTGFKSGYTAAVGWDASMLFNLTSPFLVKPTNVFCKWNGSPYVGEYYGFDLNAASSTNLIVNSSVSLTGTATIYGYRK